MAMRALALWKPELGRLGEFEWVSKKSCISYRRKKQFAMVGPATNTRVEVGLNMKGVAATARLLVRPSGQMCQYKVKLTDWLRVAYEVAG